MTALEILRELVAIPTPSHRSNLPLLEWVASFLEVRGWNPQLFPYSDDCGVAKANLIAKPHAARLEGRIELAFVCHTDTVPYAEDWNDALKLSMRDQHAHGCGACDVKGALACFLAAIDAAGSQGFDAGSALILTADEEVGCKGMERLLSSRNLQIRSAIVSEPTSLRPGIAGKGYGLARVTVHGKEAHSAFPSEGVSAIAAAAKFISRIYASEAEAGRSSDELFDPPHTTVNVGTVQGGTAKNIVAGECSFLVEWRPIPGDAPQAELARLRAIAEDLGKEDPAAKIHVEGLRAEPGFAPVASGPLQLRLREIAKHAAGPVRPAMGISFGSEASRLARVAEEVIVIGPGDMHTAHSERECVPIAELEEWTATLGTLFA